MRTVAKILIAVLSLVVTLGLVEGMIRGLGLFQTGRRAASVKVEKTPSQQNKNGKALSKRVLHPFLGWQVQSVADEGLPRGAEENRPAKNPELREVREHLEVLFYSLAEADAWIDDDPLPVDARLQGHVHTLS